MGGSDGTESLAINGSPVDARLLEPRPVRRCRLDECHAHCCTGGVWIDVGQAAKILDDAERIKPYLPEDRRDELTWFDGYVEADPEFPSGFGMGTHVVRDPAHPAGAACVFLLPDRRCALQAAAIGEGRQPWTWKPYFCALHPITVNHGRVELDDDNEIYIEGGSCQRPAEAPVPLYVLFKDELTLALGEGGYAELEKAAQANAEA